MATKATERTPLTGGILPPKLADDGDPPLKFSARSSLSAALSSVSEGASARLKKFRDRLEDHESSRVCQYEANLLGTWATFFYTAGTVWKTRQIWTVALHLVLLSSFVALVTFFVTINPEALNVSVFGVISNFLKVFVAFLLGFFLKSSMARWTATIEGFLVLFNSVRNLSMQLQALGAKPAYCEQIIRYGLLSAKFLSCELRCPPDGEGHDEDADDPESDAAKHKNDAVEHLFQDGLLTTEEADILRNVDDHSSLIWVWVALLLGRMAQDGDIPLMASPTYGRLMVLTQEAQQGIRMVYVSMTVQMPFVYVHMLAMLVHSNNIFSALSFGFTLGQCSSRILARFGIFVYASSARLPPMAGSVQGDVQLIIMTMVTSLFAPLLYQAALQIGLALAQPFNSDVGAMPTGKMIDTLERDLKHAQIMTDEPPGFDRPYFKKDVVPV